MSSNWMTELIKKLPWSATFLIAAYFLFKDTDSDLAAWVCIVVAIIALFLVIRFEYYENIIDRQEKQIIQYGQQALNSQSTAAKTVSDLTSTLAKSFGKKYKKDSAEQTETS